ncbi:serine/threonine-protein kinase Nek9-like isoform X6 [Mytilus trossulus]|uniref:serine/threonine-protein kinase Nek9-like isoform X5 n=1 Tax=Mytilus trossulus TaxID=6551 RepID=UPI003006F9F4
MCTAYPRPVFGSLHDVPNLAARHWHTIIIAEKVLNQKTIRSRISSPSFVLHSPPIITEEDSAYCDGASDMSSEGTLDCDTAKDSGKPGSPVMPSEVSHHPVETAESDMPDWLKAELDDAEVIPYPVGNQPPVVPPLLLSKTSSIKSNQPVPSVQQKPVSSNQQTSVTMPTEVSKSGESVQQNEIPEGNSSVNNTTENSVPIDVNKLLERISLLEKENKELKELVTSQAARILEMESSSS